MGSGQMTPRERSAACVARIKAVHRAVILSAESRIDDGLEDAVLSDASIQSIADAGEMIGDPTEYAALILERILVNHPFVDGNKRTALAVALYFLETTGYTLPDTEDVYRYLREIAMGIHEKDDIVVWMESVKVRIPR